MRHVSSAVHVSLTSLHYQVAWDALRLRVVEEKLVKLGVERGTGSVSLHAPHARAASVSLPR